MDNRKRCKNKGYRLIFSKTHTILSKKSLKLFRVIYKQLKYSKKLQRFLKIKFYYRPTRAFKYNPLLGRKSLHKCLMSWNRVIAKVLKKKSPK